VQHDITTQAAAVFVLSTFLFNEHSQWEYARAIGQQIGFNVTKTQRLDEIAQWMKGIPENVNYQIILYLDHTNTTGADTTNGVQVTVADVYAFLKDLFATNVVWVGQHQA
jgi:hypothetical protein